MRRFWSSSVVVVLLAALGPPALAQAPGTDGPPVAGLELLEAHGPDGAPFSDEVFLTQSPDQPTGSRDGGTAWRCEVDPGDGTAAGGYWRAKPWSATAPCALAHVYRSPGRYTITLTVTDPRGRSTTTTRDVVVGERPTERLEGLTEGDTVPLPAARSGGTWHVVVPRDTWGGHRGCDVVQPGDGRPGRVRCYGDGEHRLLLDAADGAESRALVLVQANGAPAPRPARLWTVDQALDRVRERRSVVRTGEVLWVAVEHGDPGVPPEGSDAQGDEVVCELDLGDGVRVPDRWVHGSECGTVHAWQRAGTVRIGAVARDDAGASGSSTRSVRVVLRPVWLSAAGRLDDGSVLTSAGGIARTGAFGSLSVDTGSGQEVVSTGTPRLEVWPHEVAMQVPVTVDDVPGYRARVTVSRADGSVRVAVWDDTSSVLYAGGTDTASETSLGRAATRDLRRHRRAS